MIQWNEHEFCCQADLVWCLNVSLTSCMTLGTVRSFQLPERNAFLGQSGGCLCFGEQRDNLDGAFIALTKGGKFKVYGNTLDSKLRW